MATIQNNVFRSLRVSLALASILTFASVSSAQSWRSIGSFPTAMYCAYFFDANHGVVAGVGTMWRYNNGSWTTPSMPSDNPSYFTNIRELRPGMLYATSGAPYVWYSSDSGASWHNTTTTGSFALDCYFTKDSVLHSTVQGTFARLDSNICILSNNNNAVPSYSTNGGVTWTSPSGYTSIGGFGTYADTCRKMFYACSKVGPAYYSLDSGRSWHATGPSVNADILNGADGTVYHQVSTGVLCSVDGGTHWQDIGGPPAYGIAHNMCGFGPKGKYIIATNNGVVWLYSKTDSLVPPDPLTRPDTNEVCPITQVPMQLTTYTRPWQVTMQNTSVGDQVLSPTDTSFTLLPSANPKTILFNVRPSIGQHPSKYYLYTSITDGCRLFDWTDTFTIYPVPLPINTPNLQIKNCSLSRIPLIIPPSAQNLRMRLTLSSDSGWTITPTNVHESLTAGARDTIWLTPTTPTLPIGTLIHVHATDTTACVIYSWDTTFSVVITPVPVALSWPDTVRISSCDSVRIPIALNVASCDSINIDQLIVLPVNNVLNFEATPNLVRGNMDTIWLTYVPHGKLDSTHYGLRIQSRYVPENTPFDTTLKLVGIAKGSPAPHASAGAQNLQIKECSQTPLPVYIRAGGCEDIRIDSIQFNNAGVITTGGPTGSDTIPGGHIDTLNYSIEPLYPGARFLDIDCYLYRLANQQVYDTTITVALNVSGTGGQALISAPLTDSLSNCTTSVLPVIFYTPCDSARITQCKLTIDPLINYNINKTFPITLQPDTYDTLLISFPPQGLNTTKVVYAEILGNYGGTTNTFDNTVQTRVTFACADGVATQTEQSGVPLAVSGIKASSGQLQFTLTKNDANSSACEAEIVSVLGEVVAKKNIQLTSSEDQVNWDLNGLASGEYFLRIASGDQRVTSRFVLVR